MSRWNLVMCPYNVEICNVEIYSESSSSKVRVPSISFELSL